jgi:gluconolactonase
VNRGELYVVHNCGLWGAPSDVAAGVTRIDGDGSPELLVHERLGAPNDVCIGPDGDLYFTDPVTDRGLREPIEGTVYRYGISDGTLEPLVTDRLFPNGLAFGPSGEELFVAESFAQRIVFFRPGEVQSEPRLFCELPDGQPDGICFDLEGRLWVCVPDAEIVVVLAPDGSVVHRVPCPKGSFPTNCCFAGDGDATLVITASMLGGVLAVETDTAGQPLYRSVDGP